MDKQSSPSATQNVFREMLAISKPVQARGADLQSPIPR